MIDVETIVDALRPGLTDLGLDLYDVEITGTGRARVLRVLVDREGGVDLDAIADATRAVSNVLDAPPLDAAVPGPYALEVSSPGLERPLRTQAHFARAAGETVTVKLRPTSERGARRLRGVVDCADETGFELVLDDGTTERFGYDDVTRANMVFEWGGDAKKASKPASKQSDTRKSGPARGGAPTTTSQREPVRR